MNCESNDMGTEVLPAVDKKGKPTVHPMSEVVLPLTAEEEPKTPTVGDDKRMEDPPNGRRHNYDHYHEEGGPTHFGKVIVAPKLECIPMPLDFTKHFGAGADGVQAEEQHRLLLEGDGQADERQGDPGSGLGHLRRRSSDQYRLHGDVQAPDSRHPQGHHFDDDDGIEVVNKCRKHDEAFSARD
ncbi:Cohesin subunit SA-1 [Hordeum vulgare]|nr:Cohesin subunit SA-1 [Hordeum vulgare]